MPARQKVAFGKAGHKAVSVRQGRVGDFGSALRKPSFQSHREGASAGREFGAVCMTEMVVLREFSPLYIALDILFLLLFAGMLLWKKKYITVLVGLLAGILYMLVDYGVFHLLLHTRGISEGYSLFFVLLWMSMSYGFTNFAWIWLWISKDKQLFAWSFFILLWWFSCPFLAGAFTPAGWTPVRIWRTTGAYHGAMAMILFVGYLGLILYNLWQSVPSRRVNIPWLLAIGILVQFGWEACLLIGGVRSAGVGTVADKLRVLLVNSLLETNLGMPYIYLIFLAVTRRFTEQMKRREARLTVPERIAENNGERAREK